MLKKILSLHGTNVLSKEAQKAIKGGDEEYITCPCPNGTRVIVLSTVTCEEAEVLYCSTDM